MSDKFFVTTRDSVGRAYATEVVLASDYEKLERELSRYEMAEKELPEEPPVIHIPSVSYWLIEHKSREPRQYLRIGFPHEWVTDPNKAERFDSETTANEYVMLKDEHCIAVEHIDCGDDLVSKAAYDALRAYAAKVTAELAAARKDAERWRICLQQKTFPILSPISTPNSIEYWSIKINKVCWLFSSAEAAVDALLAAIERPTEPAPSADTCSCTKSDAWSCAQDRGFTDCIACGCACHRRSADTKEDVMNTEMDGKKIKAIYWPDTEDEKCKCLRSDKQCGELSLSATYHGDRDEFWIIQIKDGVEVARHNPRYVETILWGA